MELKDLERKMLAELVRNSRRSDRELAKAIGASQPTATRIRTKLEKEGYIKEYTALPDLNKAGYELLALTFVKLDPKQQLLAKELDEFKKMHYQALENNPSVVMFIKRGMGLGYDAVIVSLHPDYGSCDKFRSFIRQQMSDRITDMDTFLVSLEEETNSLPISFYALATQLLMVKNKDDFKS
jgi:DNA-binding Lrp family transcriptional regulator